ncbi:hypothetical protein WOB59_00785 [Methylocystis sp. IM4]|uniref:hypothetical protein n=1 Tax=Methylocystis sp. IM4 TaxID=3136560 RepID=UPI00311A799E
MLDDEPGSGSSILWYEVGRSTGYRSGEEDGLFEGKHAAQRSFEAQQAADYRAGWRRIHINDHNAWVDLVNERGQRIAELENELQSLQQSLTLAEQRSDAFSRKLSRTVDFNVGMENCLWALLKAAENGKTNYPEYSELKAMVYRMGDAWIKGEILFKADSLGPYIAGLLRALDR